MFIFYQFQPTRFLLMHIEVFVTASSATDSSALSLTVKPFLAFFLYIFIHGHHTSLISPGLCFSILTFMNRFHEKDPGCHFFFVLNKYTNVVHRRHIHLVHLNLLPALIRLDILFVSWTLVSNSGSCYFITQITSCSWFILQVIVQQFKVYY